MTMPVEIVCSEPSDSPQGAMRSVCDKDKPRLTIGIPTYARPHFLVRAIGSAMEQTIPCEILVADNGKSEVANRRAISEAVEGHPSFTTGVLYKQTGAENLLGNWAGAARACSTEFFMWLQDDDVLLPNAAARAVAAFDRFPEADMWLATNKIALDDKHHWWNNGNGPWVPLRADGGIDQWEAEILRPTCYFLSWSLSPAVAFRCGPNFTQSLDNLPLDCAVFAERLILAGMTGRFVADPCVAGLWIQHKDNEHRKLHDDQPRQSTTLIEHLDRYMDATPNWPEILDMWARLQHPHWIMGWMGDLKHVQREGGKSRHGQAIHDVLFKSLEGRVKFVPRYRWWARPIHWLRRRVAS